MQTSGRFLYIYRLTPPEYPKLEDAKPLTDASL